MRQAPGGGLSAFATVMCIGAGMLFALIGISTFAVLALGTFEEGRDAAMAMAVVGVTASAALLVLPFHRPLGRALGGVALVIFATGMLLAVFSPGLASDTPGTYQAAAIALAVLLLARLGLSLRRKRRLEER
jgi:hypothetical protein